MAIPPRAKGHRSWRVATFISLGLAVSGCAAENQPAGQGGNGPGAESPSSAVRTPGVASQTSVRTTPEELDGVLESANNRFRLSPPSIHGTYEYRSVTETIRYELWVEWPAFRFELTGEEHFGPDAGQTLEGLTVATLDGKRFGVRDSQSEEPYETTDFGEGVWILGPMLSFFGESPMYCVEGHAVRTEVILERTAILFRCTESDRFDQWIDSESGLVLRQITRESNDEPGWSGFVDVEFDPYLEPALFDPESV